MRAHIKILAASVVLSGLSACDFTGTTSYRIEGDSVYVTKGYGGGVEEKRVLYMILRQGGRRIVIDGQVISADAIAAFSSPGACYTKNAVFSPHAAREGWNDYRRADLETALFLRVLPKPLADWFETSPFFYETGSYAHVDYGQLVELWPEGACDQDEAMAQRARKQDLAASRTLSSKTRKPSNG